MRLLRKWPFTSWLVGALSLAALLTHTHRRPLSNAWMRKVGFSPADLGQRQWGRIFTSALTTHGAEVFWQALSLSALFTGLAEWSAGTLPAIVTFWGVHIATLLSESLLILWPLRLWRRTYSEALAVGRDVGPSAGYFSMLGLAVQRLPGGGRAAVAGSILAILSGAFFAPRRASEAWETKLTADIAHLLAFPLGWLAGALLQSRRPGAPRTDQL